MVSAREEIRGRSGSTRSTRSTRSLKVGEDDKLSVSEISTRASRKVRVQSFSDVKIKVEDRIKVEHEPTPRRSGRRTFFHLSGLIAAVRSGSALLKGKYVESEDDEFELEELDNDNSADEDFMDDDERDDSDVDFDIKKEPWTNFVVDSDDDIYGEQKPVATTSHAPAAKKRKVASSAATPVSVKSKASSGIFSPAESADTPATSVSGSVSKAIQGVKRKLEVETITISSDEFESEEEDDDESDIVEPQIEVIDIDLAEQQYKRRMNRINRFRGRKMTQWERTNEALCWHHPELVNIWEDLENEPMIKPEAVPQPEGLSLQLLPFQREGLDWLLKQEQQVRFTGGILADEMGMGKTIQTISLLLAEPRGKPNLVIAPTVALMQWKQEIETHTDNGLSVCLFYGANRSVTAKELKNYDVVLTTYAVLESVFRKQNTGFKRADGIHKERSLLHSIEFFRVILDEAHNIKDRACNTARAAFALKTKRKLCLSGTPLQNRVCLPYTFINNTDRRTFLITSIPRS